MSKQSPSVVVGVDGSEPAAEAARAAALEADRRRLPLRIVRAFHWPSGDLAGLPDTFDACAASRRAADADLERVRHSLADRLPEWAISLELVDGRAETVLPRTVQAGDLLVVGASGLTWGAGNALGSVAEAVVATAPCPVLVHRTLHPLDWRRRGVVVGVDGGPGSAAVLAAAAAEAELRGEPLQVVHAWRQLTEDAAQSMRWRLEPGTSTAAETAAVEPLVAALRRRHPSLEVDTTVVPGRAGRVLVEATQTAALLVVGRRDITAGGPGATVHSVLHRLAIPVLTVPVAAPAAGHTAAATTGALTAPAG
ncbi:universal stress protein [Modestobacter sp. SSW1-42]|uniref:universal stress protein n=1 Tax=Modestobacter sp. SSW1-42 TaxID=596372 RepID=UPI003985985F